MYVSTLLCILLELPYKFMGFQMVFVSRKPLFFNLADDCLSCAGTTKHAWKQCYLCIANLCPPERNVSYTDGRRTSAGYPQPFKRAVIAVNCGLRESRAVCTGCETLPASEPSRRDWRPAEAESRAPLSAPLVFSPEDS